jgi:hypothetical protein
MNLRPKACVAVFKLNLGGSSHFGTKVVAAHGFRYQATEAAGLLSLTSRLTGRWIHASAMRCKARYKLRKGSK